MPLNNLGVSMKLKQGIWLCHISRDIWSDKLRDGFFTPVETKPVEDLRHIRAEKPECE
jgi:hypothetical protein